MARHYDEFAWHWRRLGQVARDGRLVFVLGAGINYSYGLPLWSGLIEQLLIESGRMPRLRGRAPGTTEVNQEELNAIRYVLGALTPDPLLQAALVRAAYPSDKAWIDAIRKHMHKADATPPATPGKPLHEIATMLVAAIKHTPGRHISVLTFNYDDYLEEAIRAVLHDEGMDETLVRSIADSRRFERSWTSTGIYVYHLHGHLKAERRADAVLDAYSYVPVLQGDHWSWRCLERVLSQVDATALMVGLSLTDPSLRFVLTRWETWRTPVLGVYLAAPIPVPKGSTLARQRQLAFLARSILDLYDAVMDRLHLVAYHLSSWNELTTILAEIRKEAGRP